MCVQLTDVARAVMTKAHDTARDKVTRVRLGASMSACIDGAIPQSDEEPALKALA